MQTFLPINSTDFSETASVLDYKRLNKQALEGWQIIMALVELDPSGNHRTPKGWKNHPAVKMWRGYEHVLLDYVECMTTEWRMRGFSTTIDYKAKATINTAYKNDRTRFLDGLPAWMEDTVWFTQITSSHRTALLTKDYEWYSQFGWAEDTGDAPDTYVYVWGVED